MAKNGNVRVVLNRSGVRQLLQSDEIASYLSQIANDTRERCGDGYEVESPYKGRNRVNVAIYPGSYKARLDNNKNNTLLKSLKG